MKKMMMTVAAVACMALTARAQWLPVSINTNTWEIKPAVFSNAVLRMFGGAGVNPLVPSGPLDARRTGSAMPYDDALLWYPFDWNGGSTLVTDQGPDYTNHATVAGDIATTNNTAVIDGIGEGHATHTYGYSGLLAGRSAFTLACWFKATAGASTNVLVSSSALSGTSNAVDVWTTEDTVNFRVGYGATTNTLTLAGAGGLHDGEWHLIAGQYEKTGLQGTSGAILRIYTNGVLATATSNNLNHFVGADGYMKVGKSWAADLTGANPNCQIDDVLVTGALWSGADLLAIYDRGWSLAYQEGRTTWAKDRPLVFTLTPEDGYVTTNASVVYTWGSQIATSHTFVSTWTNLDTTATNATVAFLPGTIGSNYWYVNAVNQYGMDTSDSRIIYRVSPEHRNRARSSVYWWPFDESGDYFSIGDYSDAFSTNGVVTWQDRGYYIDAFSGARMKLTSDRNYMDGQYEGTFGLWVYFTETPTGGSAPNEAPIMHWQTNGYSGLKISDRAGSDRPELQISIETAAGHHWASYTGQNASFAAGVWYRVIAQFKRPSSTSWSIRIITNAVSDNGWATWSGRTNATIDSHTAYDSNLRNVWIGSAPLAVGNKMIVDDPFWDNRVWTDAEITNDYLNGRSVYVMP